MSDFIAVAALKTFFNVPLSNTPNHLPAHSALAVCSGLSVVLVRSSQKITWVLVKGIGGFKQIVLSMFDVSRNITDAAQSLE